MAFLEELEQRKYLPDVDPDPRIAVLLLGILRESPRGTEWLTVREKKEDVLKKAGCLSFAGAETAKVIPGEQGGVVENVQATVLGSLSEEIFGNLSDDEEIGIRLTMLGDYWYLRDKLVVAHVATVSFNRHDFEVNASDGETEDPRWLTLSEMKQESNWRAGMDELIDLLPSLAYLHEIIFQTREEGDGWVRWNVNGETMRHFRQHRACYPDTKHAPFSMIDHDGRKGIKQESPTQKVVAGHSIGISDGNFCLINSQGNVVPEVTSSITDELAPGNIIVEFNQLGLPTQAIAGTYL